MLRKIDALVSKKVFKQDHDFDNCTWCQSKDSYTLGNPHIPLYSTNIAAAWQVVEKMGEDSASFPFLLLEDRYTGVYTGGKWIASFGVEMERHDKVYIDYCEILDWKEEMKGLAVGVGEPPLAICLAALRAVGVTEDEIEEALK